MLAAWILFNDDELKAWANEGNDWAGELWWVAMKINHGQQKGVAEREGGQDEGKESLMPTKTISDMTRS